MGYLLDFVRTFDDSEMQAFRRLDITGKEEEVRDLYVHHARNKRIDETTLARRADITRVHFDKINSVLLDKVILALYGNDTPKTIYGILNKGLTGLLLHELKIRERRILATKDKPAIQGFYKDYFNALRGMLHPHYNPKLTRQYGAKYLAWLGKDKTISDEAYVELFILYGDILQQTFMGKALAYRPRVQKELERWDKRLQGKNNPVATFYHMFLYATMYKHMSEEVAAYVVCNEKALKAFYEAGGAIDSKYEGIVTCEIGFGYLAMDQYEKAQEYYRKATELFPDSVGISIYHQTVYMSVCIANRDYALAQSIFERVFRPRIQSDNIIPNLFFEAYSLALCLALNRRNLQEAEQWYKGMMKIKGKDVTMTGRIMLRFWEAAYFLVSGDYKTAASLATRHTRYIQKNKERAATYHYQVKYLDCIMQLTKLKSGNKQAYAQLKQRISNLPNGVYYFYNTILHNQLEHMAGNSSPQIQGKALAEVS